MITGSATGIGSATARLFAEHGAKLVLIDRNEPPNEATAAELEKAGTSIAEAPGYRDEEVARVTSLNRADGDRATEDDGNAVHIATDGTGAHITVPVIVGWKELGYEDRYSYHSSPANKGPVTDEQKAERKP